MNATPAQNHATTLIRQHVQRRGRARARTLATGDIDDVHPVKRLEQSVGACLHEASRRRHSHVADGECHVGHTSDDAVEATCSARRPLRRDADGLLERDLEVVEPCAILGALADPLGAPRRLRIVETNARHHGGRKLNGGRGLAVNVVTALRGGKVSNERQHDTSYRCASLNSTAH